MAKKIMLLSFQEMIPLLTAAACLKHGITANQLADHIHVSALAKANGQVVQFQVTVDLLEAPADESAS